MSLSAEAHTLLIPTTEAHTNYGYQWSRLHSPEGSSGTSVGAEVMRTGCCWTNAGCWLLMWKFPLPQHFVVGWQWVRVIAQNPLPARSHFAQHSRANPLSFAEQSSKSDLLWSVSLMHLPNNIKVLKRLRRFMGSEIAELMNWSEHWTYPTLNLCRLEINCSFFLCLSLERNGLLGKEGVLWGNESVRKNPLSAI